VRAVLALLAAALAVLAYRLLHHDLDQEVVRSLPTGLIGLTAVAAGLIAWGRERSRRIGTLMTALGFAVLVRPWQYSHESGLFTVGFLLSELNLALFAHVTFAYPFGRVTDRLERWFVATGYAVALFFPFATLLFYDGMAPLNYVPPGTESIIRVASSDRVVEDLQDAFVFLGYGVLTAVFVALVVRKFAGATPRMRRILLPLLLAAVIAAVRALSEVLFVFVSPPPAIVDRLYWWQVAGQIALPIALLAGLLSSRLARANVADLVRELDHVAPRELPGALARALGDPSLEVAYWLPERGAYADADGHEVELPGESGRRAVTVLEHEGEPIAALLHDPALRADPELVEAAGAAARLALENARLHAEVQAQLAQVQASRVRIVEAGDEQRRKIERDIHDGAQQRLVALALELRTAQRKLGVDADPEIATVLDQAVGELQLAVSELRELARGVHPAILTEEGLGAALDSVAGRTPIPVEIVSVPAARLPPEIEAAGYFVACEALANAVKHADATGVTINAYRIDGTLVVEVVDDGRGGAEIGAGSGLRGLSDRVEAYGGRLVVNSPTGGGTRVRAELPCGS
jgi:signal transduction histidine kinase